MDSSPPPGKRRCGVVHRAVHGPDVPHYDEPLDRAVTSLASHGLDGLHRWYRPDGLRCIATRYRSPGIEVWNRDAAAVVSVCARLITAASADEVIQSGVYDVYHACHMGGRPKGPSLRMSVLPRSLGLDTVGTRKNLAVVEQEDDIGKCCSSVGPPSMNAVR